MSNPEGNEGAQVLAKRATWLAQFPALVKAEQREALQREIKMGRKGEQHEE